MHNPFASGAAFEQEGGAAGQLMIEPVEGPELLGGLDDQVRQK